MSTPSAAINPDDRQAAMQHAVHAVGGALRQTKYAIIGGAACMLLGSSRYTEDIDIVVPTGQTPAARQELRSAGFTIEPKTLHTNYEGIEIEILAPPGLFKERYDVNTPTIEVQQVRVLEPALILNAKCRSILGRAKEDKKVSDSIDILFLLRWFVDNPQHPKPTVAEVPNATKEFRDWFTHSYCATEEQKALWEQAGFGSD
ncbi:hypothetical protein FQN57_000555 [Myotisia sp. PD_48]|nr:hypothetical protein FQN57_000555 [Myotisia sp. PD_48]